MTFRFIYLDFQRFGKDVWNIFDFVISWGSLILMETISEYGKWLVLLRLIRLLRVLALGWRAKLLVSASARKTVAGTRRRYQEDGFDIDVTYITDRLLAMSIPATGGDAYFRNPCDEVARFFRTKHANHFHIFNACPERYYPYEKFDHQVTEYYFDDHNTAPLQLLLDCVEDMSTWLAKDHANVATVHCKGGKGRTGTILCCYMLYIGMFKDPEESLVYFGKRRTASGGKGKSQRVEAASQERYIHYFGQLCQQPRPIVIGEGKPLKILWLTKVKIHALSPVDDNFRKMWFQVRLDGKYILYDQRMDQRCSDCARVRDDFAKNYNKTEDSAEWIPDEPIMLQGDMKFEFYAPSFPQKELFLFWFHTNFETSNPLIYNRSEVDGIKYLPKERKKRFPKNFKMEFHFGDPPSTAPAKTLDKFRYSIFDGPSASEMKEE